MIEFQKKEISFYRNDKSLGIAFKNIKIGPNMAYFPAISLSEGERVLFNFGFLPFKCRLTCNSLSQCKAGDIQCSAINEPECNVKDLNSSIIYLIEAIKRFVFVYFDFPALSEDYRLIAGSVIWEYLLPIITRSHYLLEYQVVQFFYEISNMP